MFLRRRERSRRGAAIVEAALSLTVFCLMLFGIFEYCRFLMVLHVLENSGREAVRYASVNVEKPGTFDSTDYTDGAGVTHRNISDYAKERLVGARQQLANLKVAVFAVDPAGLQLPTPVIRPKSKSTSTFPDPFNSSDPDAVPWNTASYPDRIAVRIKGEYRPVLPGFLLMPSSIPLDVTIISGSES